MTQKTMISIWFWVGLVLGVYGLMIVGLGVYYIFVPDAARVTLAQPAEKSDEEVAEQQRKQAGDATRAEAISRSSTAARNLAAATRQLRQSVSDPVKAARLDQVAQTLASVSVELREEAEHLTRPPVEMKIMVGQVGGNPALWWGIIMLIFGGLFLAVGHKANRENA